MRMFTNPVPMEARTEHRRCFMVFSLSFAPREPLRVRCSDGGGRLDCVGVFTATYLVTGHTHTHRGLRGRNQFKLRKRQKSSNVLEAQKAKRLPF